MDNSFLHCDSFPAFETLRSDPFTQMTHAIAGEKNTRAITTPHLNILANVESNAFTKFSHKEACDHHAEVKFNQFCQFFHDGDTLNSEEMHQDFGIQFKDRMFSHNNYLELTLRKVPSSESDEVSELAEDARVEALDKAFIGVFVLSVRDLAASKIASELNVEKV